MKEGVVSLDWQPHMVLERKKLSLPYLPFFSRNPQIKAPFCPYDPNEIHDGFDTCVAMQRHPFLTFGWTVTYKEGGVSLEDIVKGGVVSLDWRHHMLLPHCQEYVTRRFRLLWFTRIKFYTNVLRCEDQFLVYLLLRKFWNTIFVSFSVILRISRG